MNYGNLVTIVPDKVRISEKELAPIGIIDKSSCWGRWIPDRWQPGSDNAPPPHLVVSPFPNTSWPALFRLTIILENAAHGTLAKVLDVVDQHALNILSIEGTPAGHRHAVVNIIGEAVDLKLKNDAIKRICDIPDGERLFTNDALSELIHARYAPTMLTYADRLESALIAADEKRDGRFLRETFCRHRSVDGPRGILYDYERLSPEYARLGERQSIPAVKCKWLQNHAFFWAYGSGDTQRVFTHTALRGTTESGAPHVAFLLPGGGAQYARMTAGLFEHEPVFREHMERGLELLRRLAHRAATGCDPETGDGAGILLQLSRRFF